MAFQYTIDDIARLDSPALVVYPQVVRHNIDLAIQMAGSADRLRPHVKTHKSPDVTRLMLEAGIQKFKCATIAEAEMLGHCGAPDVVLAYQPVGPKVLRFLELIRKFPATHFACLVDDLSAAQAIAAAFAAQRMEATVWIDLNIGQDRTGIAPESAFDLYVACADMEGIRPVGLQAYDGHLRHSDLQAREAACNEAFDRVKKLQKTLRQAVFSEPKIIAGGSPTFAIHARREGVECSPGTFVYWDKGYSDLCPDQLFRPAALLITRVISLPDADKICLDLGHKSVAAENPVDHRVFFPDAPGLTPIGQSEEHLVVEVEPGHTWKTGDVLYALPFHICPTVALHERAFTVENGQWTGAWRTVARDRTLSI
ncbi:MAG: D-TA family PLP-dependent enzyme [Saprospiraceae bacterium]|nr:D-TA family PLP-dependent enzyme [Saprospiraceae bacterium]